MQRWKSATVIAALLTPAAPAKNFKDQQVILYQPAPPKYKTLASNAILEFEPFNGYSHLEELGLAITQELQKGQMRIVGPADPAQVRIRVRLSAYQPGRVATRSGQESRSVEVTSGNTKACRDQVVPVAYEEGGGQLTGSVTIDEGAQKLVYAGAINASYRFSWLRSFNHKPIQPGDPDPCSGMFWIGRRPYQDPYGSSPALSVPEIEAQLRRMFAIEVGSVLVKTDRSVPMRLSAEEKLTGVNQLLATQQWTEAVRAAPSCDKGIPKGDCLYTRALAQEAAAYALFSEDPTAEKATAARVMLVQAVGNYQAALTADPKERVISDNAARVRSLLVDWDRFIEYAAWMRTATPPEALPARVTQVRTPAQEGSKSSGGGDRTFTTNEQQFRLALRAELAKREEPDERFVSAKVSEAAYLQPPIPTADARAIVNEEVERWRRQRETERIYREKVLLFLDNGKVTDATLQNLKFWEERLGLNQAAAAALRQEVAQKSARGRVAGGKRP